MADKMITIADYGTNQQEAVGLGAVYDFKFDSASLSASIPVLDTGAGMDVITPLLASIFESDNGVGVDAAVINMSMAIYEGTQTMQESVGLGAVYDPSLDIGHGSDALSLSASIPVLDTGAGMDVITPLLASIFESDNGVGIDVIAPLLIDIPVPDAGVGIDVIAPLLIDIPVPDAGAGIDTAVIIATMSVSDAGHGIDDTREAAKAYFYVTQEGVLNPLGVIVLRDSRYELLPDTRENSEEIPGRHGDVDFGSDFSPRVMELHVASKEEFDHRQREKIRATLAKCLNPIMGPQKLIFGDDIEKTYMVKYAGKIDLAYFFNWLEFTIPFKAGDPFIIGSFEKTHVGNGTLINEGTFETPLVITVTGPVANPVIKVGDATLGYTGVLAGGDALTIDTGAMTVRFNGVPALNYSGGFPKLQPGDTQVVAANGGITTFTWRDRWI